MFTGVISLPRGLIHHVEINVSDIKKSVEFWDWFLKDLGYRIYQK
ncbi:hypothetical protein JOD45_000699 [Scopulibacillus daqui]|uniref:Glyoxalase/bleomycin resistance protein/dioxygenase superfamily protein n=1 Tax=Scopulibacillus daqui TaxID=1469162 RepID=A0ABS2PWT4_9BACL|nr:hypothetical protein [Scopulibacillus daqui]